ncbi:MAG TPA: glycosyltransferase [Crocinitomix sp.]|nr:glycosyltransferase [Crocinitomix sp.]
MKKKLNVLFISSWYPNRLHPTLGNFVQKHAEIINPLVNLYVLTVIPDKNLKDDFDIDQQIINGVNTTIVYYPKIKTSFPIVSQTKKYHNLLTAYKRGYESILEQNPINFDITHCNITYQSSVFARHLKSKFNIPYIITEHSTVFSPHKNEYKKLKFLHQLIIKKGIKNASYVTTVSEHLKQSMLKLGLFNTYKVIPNVVNTSIFKPSKSTIEKKGKAVILHISHMGNQQKNSVEMLKVIKKISTYRTDFVFKIIADDNIESTKALIKKFNLSQFVILESTKTTEQIASEMNKASFFLLYSNYETFSVVLAEAWCSGLPAVYSKCGGLTDIHNRNLGVQIEVNNNLQLEKVLDNMLNTYHHYNPYVISEIARTKFEASSVGNQFLNLYKKVIKH